VLWAVRIAILLVVVLGILTLIGLPFDITLWDWLDLLVVPAAIAAGGLWFNAQQSKREQGIARQRAQDEALQEYLNKMGELILDKDKPLHRSDAGDELGMLARARTLTMLDALAYSPEHQRRVLRFLHETMLIQASKPGVPPIVSLKYARLIGAELRNRRLLKGANLSQANLTDADLSGANLAGTELRNAKFTRANLKDAKGVTNEELAGQTKSEFLEDTMMPNGQKYEDWLKDK
jgi:hypothetical protein